MDTISVIGRSDYKFIRLKQRGCKFVFVYSKATYTLNPLLNSTPDDQCKSRDMLSNSLLTLQLWWVSDYMEPKKGFQLGLERGVNLSSALKTM